MKITKIIRCDNKGTYAIVHVQLEHGGVAEVYVGGDGKEIFHAGKLKFYITPPWQRKGQSRKISLTS